MATILRAKVVPEVGGDTLFASMSAAYRGLSERMKQHIHGLEAQHDFKPWRPLLNHADRYKLRKLEDEFPNPWHPVVRVHPVTGRRVEAGPDDQVGKLDRGHGAVPRIVEVAGCRAGLGDHLRRGGVRPVAVLQRFLLFPQIHLIPPGRRTPPVPSSLRRSQQRSGLASR